MTHGQVEDNLLGRLAQTFTELGADLAEQNHPDTAIAIITDRATRVVPGAEHAAVTRGRPGAFETVAATSSVPLQVDQIQYELGSGPCIDAIVGQRVYRTGDLEHDSRWPAFGRLAVQRAGVRSMLSFRMFLEDDDLIAGLSLYAGKRNAFPSESEQTALLLATHGVAILASSRRQREIDNLERALVNSRDIGTATGILMSRHKVTKDQAFALLRVASQHRQQRLSLVARDVIDTGTLDFS